MRVDRIVAAFRQVLIDWRSEHEETYAYGPWLPQDILPSKADAASAYPCLVLEAAGGPGSINPGMYVMDIAVTALGMTGEQVLYDILAAVSRACHRKKAADMAPPIIWSAETGAPAPAGVGDLLGLRTQYQVIAREWT